MKMVTFIRHGLIPGNEERRYIGITDQSLSASGLKQAGKLYKYYNSRAGAYHYPLGKLFISPMLRCVETAKNVFPDEEFKICNDLREMNFGVFEGRSYKDMEHDTQYREWVDSGCESDVPEGECLDAFVTRCVSAFMSCMKEVPEGGKACFVVHGGTIKAIVSRLGTGERFFDIEVPNCEPLSYIYEDGKLIGSDNSYKFFPNRDCKYFPCHKVDNLKEFNCLFCYCPLYFLGDKCGGDFSYNEKGVKSCINCSRPHQKKSYDEINSILSANNK